MRKELLEAKNRTGNPPLMGYLPALYPGIKEYEAAVECCAHRGLRFLELGVPSPHPYLDGEIIRGALKGLSFGTQKDQRRRFRESIVPVKNRGFHALAMIYNETLEAWGLENFTGDCAEGGLEGILVPNITRENRQKLSQLTRQTGLEIVSFIGSEMTAGEIQEAAELTTGFLYVQSTRGMTGGQFVPDEEARQRVEAVKEAGRSRELPVAMGFGINTPEDAREAARLGADGVIVGTSFVRAAGEGIPALDDFLSGFYHFLEEKVCRN